MKIGMYSDGEILEHLTEGEGRGFLGRSMYDAIKGTLENKDKEIDRLNNIINELEKDIKNLYTYGIKNNAEQRDYLLNRLDGLKELKENK